MSKSLFFFGKIFVIKVKFNKIRYQNWCGEIEQYYFIYGVKRVYKFFQGGYRNYIVIIYICYGDYCLLKSVWNVSNVWIFFGVENCVGEYYDCNYDVKF